jgi:hypothetical protein
MNNSLSDRAGTAMGLPEIPAIAQLTAIPPFEQAQAGTPEIFRWKIHKLGWLLTLPHGTSPFFQCFQHHHMNSPDKPPVSLPSPSTGKKDSLIVFLRQQANLITE